MSLQTTLKIGFNATEVKRGLDGLSGKVAGFASSVAKVGVATLAAGLTAAGIAVTAFAKSASEAAASMESLETQFSVLMKSGSGAKDMISDFRKEAQKSPLSVEDYAKAGKTLMAFGMSSEKVMPTLKALGDVSMGNSERFGSLALAFAQTQAAGRLMGQEVLQFVNAGFNPLQQISKTTGRSMVELKKAMEDGAISADMVTQAFQDATREGGLFYGALERGSQTTEGKIAKLKDTIFGLKVAFGTGFNEGLKDALDASNNFLPKFEANMKIAGQFVGSAITESVNGDTAKFELVGRFIGDLILHGMTAAVEKGSAALGAGIVNSAGQAFKYTPFGLAYEKMKGKGSIQAGLDSFNTSLAEGMQSRGEQRWNLSGSKVSMDQLKQEYNKIKTSNSNTELKGQIVSAIKSQMSEEFSPGGPKVQVSIGKAIGILMSIDKKIGTPSPAKM